MEDKTQDKEVSLHGRWQDRAAEAGSSVIYYENKASRLNSERTTGLISWEMKCWVSEVIEQQQAQRPVCHTLRRVSTQFSK